MWLILLFLFGNDIHNDLVKSQKYEESQLLTKICKFTPDFFFYRAIANYKTKNYKEALRNIDQLLMISPPERYYEVGVRLKEEIQREKNKLDDISADMNLVKERLEIGKGGAKTQEIQKQIVKKLDEEINQLEQEINKKQEQNNSGRTQNKVPMEDTKIVKDAPPEGKLDKKKIINGGEWGQLPKKEMSKVAEQIHRNVPPHILEASQGFLKKLQIGVDSQKK